MFLKECYALDHVAGLFSERLSKDLRGRYLKSWSQWVVWCHDHNLQPCTASRTDVGQFVDQRPPQSRNYIQNDISTVYFKLGVANPARDYAR